MQQHCIMPGQGDKHRKGGMTYRMGNRKANRAPRLSEVRRTAWYKNLKECYSRATQEAIEEGLVWYENANSFANQLATQYNLGPDTVAQIIAALSPAAKWDRNLVDAENMVKAFYHRGYIGAKAVTVCTYGKNKEKALDILCGKLQLTPKQGLKTYNFWNNIHNPKERFFVTIDRHALRVLLGTGERGAVAIKPHQYAKASLVYRVLADELGLTPNQLQAIVWVQYRSELTSKGKAE